MTARGQTLSDYLLGVVLVVVTITAVFAYFPGLFVPFQEPTGSDERTMANDLSTEILTTNSTGGNTVNYTAMTASLDDSTTRTSITRSAGLQQWRNWNVTIRSEQTGGTVYQTGGNSAGQPAATATRYFQAVDEPACESGCRLTVRVW